MGWTYSGNPASSEKDALRFTIGDTDPDDPELQDEELNYILNDVGPENIVKAGISALRKILAKYKNLQDEKVGDVDVKWSQRFRRTKDTLDDLIREHAKMNLGSAYAGGISIADKQNQEGNTDRVSPAFTKTFGQNKRISGSGIPRENTSQLSN